jgi:putative restriction endonuclease
MADRVFGRIPGIAVGTIFPSRRALKEAGLHSQLIAGISGGKPEGADAVVLSGEYEDDEDWGEEAVYTGQGGRDDATGKQVADQELTRGNLGLVITRNKGLPLRIIRKIDNLYRYDGLYRVADAWHEKGKSGHRVWRYRLVALERDGMQPGQVDGGQPELEDAQAQAPPKRTSIVSRVVRDTAAHIRQLGAPHNGPDTYDNLICLCPNHHVLFDLGGFTIADDLTLMGIPGQLTIHASHKINPGHIKYHREHYS